MIITLKLFDFTKQIEVPEEVSQLQRITLNRWKKIGGELVPVEWVFIKVQDRQYEFDHATAKNDNGEDVMTTL